MANSQPVEYVVCLSYRHCAFRVVWNFCTMGSLAQWASLGSLMYWMRCTPAPVWPWSISGWMNWLNEPHVPEETTIGFQFGLFSSSENACVQIAPDVSTSATSALEADIVVI